jgi:hypothetical protein
MPQYEVTMLAHERVQEQLVAEIKATPEATLKRP